MSDEIRIVRADDPVRAELEGAGFSAVGESWAARLRVDERTILRLRQLLADVDGLGTTLRRMRDDEASEVARLDTDSIPDYPYTPATVHEAPTPERIRELDRRGRVYVALDGDRLSGVTVMQPEADRWETDFTSVARASRGRGIATALKAYAVLDLVADGVRTFGTGGAQLNEASRRMNVALGYVIEETWISYRRVSE